jgi:hypothetical protein
MTEYESKLLAEFYVREWSLSQAMKRKQGTTIVSHEYRSIHNTRVCINYNKKTHTFTELIAFSPEQDKLFIKIKL